MGNVSLPQFHPDRLILGTRSLSKLGKLFLGSVAEQVLRSVNLPVFTLGPEADLPTEKRGGRSTILFATTLGEGHLANAALACRLATSKKVKLILLNVLPATGEQMRPGWSNTLHSTISCELKQLAARIGDLSRKEVEIKVVNGNPASEILAQAEANHASLIVMGAADHSIFESITHDRTLCKVLAHAHCPVLSLHGAVAENVQNQADITAAHAASAARV